MRLIDADALFKTVNRKFYSAFEVGSKDSENGRFRRGYNVAITDACEAITAAPTLSPDDVRGVGEWEDAGKQMVINLENAREQYSALGYPHRTELKRRCSSCKKITLVDASIQYRYCPHCGARMKGASEDG